VTDRYVLFADGEMSSGLAWDIVFENGEAAGNFEKVARQSAAAMAEDGRLLDVVRLGEKRVRFLNVATGKALEKFKIQK